MKSLWWPVGSSVVGAHKISSVTGPSQGRTLFPWDMRYADHIQLFLRRWKKTVAPIFWRNPVNCKGRFVSLEALSKTTGNAPQEPSDPPVDTTRLHEEGWSGGAVRCARSVLFFEAKRTIQERKWKPNKIISFTSMFCLGNWWFPTFFSAVEFGSMS